MLDDETGLWFAKVRPIYGRVGLRVWGWVWSLWTTTSRLELQGVPVLSTVAVVRSASELFRKKVKVTLEGFCICR